MPVTDKVPLLTTLATLAGVVASDRAEVVPASWSVAPWATDTPPLELLTAEPPTTSITSVPELTATEPLAPRLKVLSIATILPLPAATRRPPLPSVSGSATVVLPLPVTVKRIAASIEAIAAETLELECVRGASGIDRGISRQRNCAAERIVSARAIQAPVALPVKPGPSRLNGMPLTVIPPLSVSAAPEATVTPDDEPSAVPFCTIS